MNVEELIEILKRMPPKAEIQVLYEAETCYGPVDEVRPPDEHKNRDVVRIVTG